MKNALDNGTGKKRNNLFVFLVFFFWQMVQYFISMSLFRNKKFMPDEMIISKCFKVILGIINAIYIPTI